MSRKSGNTAVHGPGEASPDSDFRTGCDLPEITAACAPPFVAVLGAGPTVLEIAPSQARSEALEARDFLLLLNFSVLTSSAPPSSIASGLDRRHTGRLL